MLSAETIKPLLLHEDRHVRTAAVEYLADSWSRDPELVPLLLSARRRFGRRRSEPALARAHRFPLREPAFDEVFRQLARVRDLNSAFDMSRIVAEAPVELLRKHEAAILESARLVDELRPYIRHRLEFASWAGGATLGGAEGLLGALRRRRRR